jgi:hypothetical protein
VRAAPSVNESFLLLFFKKEALSRPEVLAGQASWRLLSAGCTFHPFEEEGCMKIFLRSPLWMINAGVMFAV